MEVEIEMTEKDQLQMMAMGGREELKDCCGMRHRGVVGWDQLLYSLECSLSRGTSHGAVGSSM